MSKRAAIYTRVSKEEQTEGYSLDAQLQACERQCETQGWQIVKVYSDPGVSAKNAERPLFQQMITDVERGHIDVVVVHKLDRFSRSLVDTITYLTRLKNADCGFKSVTEGKFDFTTPEGWLFMTMLAIFAEWYLRNLSQEVKKGLNERANRGDWNGRLAYGYATPRKLHRWLLGETDPERCEVIEQTLEKWKHVHDTAAIPCPFTSHIVVWIFKTYVYENIPPQKTSLQDICDQLNEQGYRSGNGMLWQMSPLRRLIKTRTYLGEIKHDGQWLPGNHQPLISVDLFNAAQAQLIKNRTYTGKRHGGKKQKVYPLSGILKCEVCGGNITGQGSHGYRRYKDKTRDRGGVCDRKPVTVSARHLEGQVKKFLIEVVKQLPDDWQQQIIERVQNPEKPPDNTALIAKYEAQSKRAKNLYILGDLTEQEYLEMRNNLNSKINALSVRNAGQLIYDIDKISKMLKNIGAIINNADLGQQRALFQTLLSNVYIDGRDIVAIEPSPVLWHIINCGPECRSPQPS